MNRLLRLARPLTLPLILLCCLAGVAQAKPKHPKHGAKPAPRAPASTPGRAYALRPEVMAQADDMAARNQLDPQWTRSLLGQARELPLVRRLMLPPPAGQKKNWTTYRANFIDPVRVRAGAAFWQSQQDWLARAEATYGVPAQMVVGIIGIETIYGQQMGNFRVLDALANLAFDFPLSHPRAQARQAFFRAELEQFLVLMARGGGDALAVRGSYAGAIGMPQFMPSSIARFAVDFDGDGRIDLQHSAADVIGSVANYFKAHGWSTGMPTHYPVRLDLTRLDLDALLAPDILPTFSVQDLAAKGVLLNLPDTPTGQASAPVQGPLALIELQRGDAAPDYVAGTGNFYTVTRYNWSSYYAMAVIELGQTVAASLTGAAVPATATATPIPPQ